MKLLVITDSCYGASRRYGQWIAEQTGGRWMDRKQVAPQDLAQCQELIYGAGIYAGSLTGGKWLAGQAELLEGKKLAIFACGMLDPQAPGAAEQVRQQLARVLPQRMLDRAQVFLLRGAMDYSRMTGKHRAMMAGLRLFLLFKGGRRSPADQAILDGYGKKLDLVNESDAAPILVAVAHRRSRWRDCHDPY